MISLLDDYRSRFRPLFQNQSDKIIRLLRLGLHILLGGMVGLLVGERRRIRTVRYFFKLCPPFGKHFEIRSFFIISIDGFSVSCHNRRHIIDTFHTPLDFKRRHTCFDKLGNMVNHAKILAVENVRAVLIFLDGKILPRSRLFHNGIFKPAGLYALPAVRLAFSVCKIIGQKTAAAPGNTKSAVPEYFQFHVHLFVNVCHFLDRYFTGQNHTGRPHFLPPPDCPPVRRTRLCADMDRKFRRRLTADIKNAHIRHKYGINMNRLQIF